MPISTISLDDAFDIGRLDAHDQAALVAKGELASSDLVEAAILRIEALEPQSNAITWRAFDEARARASAMIADPAGPLSGVPYLLKDSLEYPGMPAKSGSHARNDGPSDRRYPLVACYDAAGLVPLGKSAMPEFALLPSTEPVRFGPTINPWDAALSVGGSSGGAAVAVASGMVPLAHASDGAGSIRIPAACCSLVGLKPGRGGNARARAHDLLEDLLCGDSLLGRTVRDVAAGWAIGREERTPPPPEPRRVLRIAVCLESHDGEQPHPAVADAVLRAAAICERLGHRIIEWKHFPFADVRPAFHTAWAHVGGIVVDHVRARIGDAADDLLEPWTLGLGEWRDSLPLSSSEDLFRVLGSLPQRFATLFEDCDILLSPVTRDPPPALGVLAPTRDFADLRREMLAYVSYTPAANLAGLPSISLPTSAPASPPIGTMWTAAHGGEPILLSIAQELEVICDWPTHWPDAL